MPVSLRRILFATLTPLGLFAAFVAAANAAQQATGIKIVETTATSATIWTRLTRDAERVPDDGPLPITKLFDRTSGKEIPLRDNATYTNGRPVITFPPGVDLGSIRGAAMGANGQTRVRHRPASGGDWTATAWRDVDPRRDFTATFPLAGLQPGTRYEVAVEGRRGAEAAVATTVTG